MTKARRHFYRSFSEKLHRGVWSVESRNIGSFIFSGSRHRHVLKGHVMACLRGPVVITGYAVYRGIHTWLYLVIWLYPQLWVMGMGLCRAAQRREALWS